MRRKRSVWRHPDLLRLGRQSIKLSDKLFTIDRDGDPEAYQKAIDALNDSYAEYNARRRALASARANAGSRT
jgi:hypothetical protein